jgi:hypothetical protein
MSYNSFIIEDNEQKYRIHIVSNIINDVMNSRQTYNKRINHILNEVPPNIMTSDTRYNILNETQYACITKRKSLRHVIHDALIKLGYDDIVKYFPIISTTIIKFR